MKITYPECQIELDVDEARRNYFNKCQDFKEQQTHFLENFKPHHYGKEQSTPAHL